MLSSKPFKPELQDLIKANLILLKPQIRLHNTVFGIVGALFVIGLSLMLWSEGLPRNGRELMFFVAGLASTGALLAVSAIVGNLLAPGIRRQLNDRVFLKHFDKEVTVVLEDGVLRSSKANGVEVSMPVDDLHVLADEPSKLTLFHPGIRMIVVLRKEDFKTDESWKQLLDIVETVPRVRS